MLLVIFKLVPLLGGALLSFTEALITKQIQGKTFIRTMAQLQAKEMLSVILSNKKMEMETKVFRLTFSITQTIKQGKEE